MKASPVAADIMRRTLCTITPGETLSTAQALMEREGIHQLPVTDNGRLIGMVSERDLRPHSGYYERTRVDAAMSYDPVTVPSACSVLHIARVLREKRVNALPVVEGERLVGIVSRTDLLHVLIDLLEQQSTQA